MTITVRALGPADWRLWRDMRLRALADSPDSFGSTLEVAASRADDEWLPGSRDHERYLMAYVDERPVGMGYVGVDTEAVAHVFAMWVDPAVRRMGVASALLDAMKAFASGQGATRMVLRASRPVEAALELYRKAGYVATGSVTPLREGSDVETIELQLDLRA